MIGNSIIFDPHLPWAVIGVLAFVAALAIGLALWRGLSGWWLRLLAALTLVLALANPSLQTEDRAPLEDIVLLLVDKTSSQALSDRAAQTAVAVERVRGEVGAMPNTELRIVDVPDDAGNAGSLLMTALSDALAEIPTARLAGVIMVTDGKLHDANLVPDLPAPLHALLTGYDTDWDRRLIIKNAPAFAILGEETQLTLRIEDQGAVPAELPPLAQLFISVDGAEPQVYDVPTGQDIDVPVMLPHGGMNVIQFTLEAAKDELTDRNNAAVVQINGVRDRLSVLLVSGEPHPGERTWRNLLKSDSSVDLVHFTILRPPEKQDGVPVTELSLIAFPTRELFLDKIDEFDLIIFDRYKRRGILPSLYLDNVRQYVEDGGAVLVAAGPDFATANSIFRSPLADVLPAAPTARVIEEGFLPTVTDLGQRHPVTQGLNQELTAGQENWGRWFRLIEVENATGQTVMTGTGARPLLVLERVGEGRVALLASDHAWLWNRGYEGGGPQAELLRRLAHWMMKEPELEEEALRAEVDGQRVIVTRRSLEEVPRSVDVTGPDGALTTVPLEEVSPGLFVGEFEGGELGLYRVTDGDLEAVVALGPSAPKEFEETIANDAQLGPLVAPMRGGVLAIEKVLPDLRQIRPGRVSAGRGWVGITPRNAYVTTDVRITPLAPAWLFLLAASMFSVLAWLREGRR